MLKLFVITAFSGLCFSQLRLFNDNTAGRRTGAGDFSRGLSLHYEFLAVPEAASPRPRCLQVGRLARPLPGSWLAILALCPHVDRAVTHA